MAATRPWPTPPADRLATLDIIGDVHVGVSTFIPGRLDKLGRDVTQGIIENLDGTVQIGDCINSGDGDGGGFHYEDPVYLDWTAEYLRSLPFAQVLGNHDIWGNYRSPAQWAATYGLPAANHVVQAGGVSIICVAPDELVGLDQTHGGAPAIQLSDATVAWLDQQLTLAGPAVVACHAPLPEMTGNPLNTVNTDTGGAAAADLLAVLEAHANVAAWVSGHTHVAPDSPEIVGQANLGSRTLPHVNAGWVGCYSLADQVCRPITSVYVTVRDDLSVEVRYRDHGGGVWWGPRGPKVTALASGRVLKWDQGTWDQTVWGL